MERDWRKKLATLLASLERIWGLKTRVALGATVASIVSLAALPAARAEAKTDSTEIAETAPRKPGKLAGSEPPFSGDKFVCVGLAVINHRYRLGQAVLFDGFG